MAEKEPLRRVNVSFYERDLDDAKHLIQGSTSRIIRLLFHQYMERLRRQHDERVAKALEDFGSDDSAQQSD